MNRKEAEALVGRRVSAWTSANGTYVGVLERVTDDRPWRGVVRIDGVLEPAVCFEAGRMRPRRGYRVGETIEVGNSSLEASDRVGADDYFGLLLAQAAQFRDTHARFLAGGFGDPDDAGPRGASLRKYYGWMGRAADDVERAVRILRQKERLEGLLAEHGEEAFRAAAAEVARAGGMGPGRDRFLDMPGYRWEGMVHGIVGDPFTRDEDREALVDRLQEQLAAAAPRP